MLLAVQAQHFDQAAGVVVIISMGEYVGAGPQLLFRRQPYVARVKVVMRSGHAHAAVTTSQIAVIAVSTAARATMSQPRMLRHSNDRP